MSCLGSWEAIALIDVTGATLEEKKSLKHKQFIDTAVAWRAPRICDHESAQDAVSCRASRYLLISYRSDNT